jgi:serine/threonine protein kinase
MTVEVVSGAARSAMFAKDFLPVGRNPPPPSLLGGFGREFGVRAPGFDGAAGSAKLRKNADRATLLHVTILQPCSRVNVQKQREAHPMLPPLPGTFLSPDTVVTLIRARARPVVLSLSPNPRRGVTCIEQSLLRSVVYSISIVRPSASACRIFDLLALNTGAAIRSTMAAASEVGDDAGTDRQRFRFHRAPQTLTQHSESVVLQKTRSPLKTINMLSLLVADTFDSADFQLEMGRIAHIPADFVGSGRSFSTFYGDYGHGCPIAFKRVRFNTGEPVKVTDEQWEPRADLVQAISLELRALTHPPLRNHENIIKLLGFGWENDILDEKYLWPVLIVEYATFGNLGEYLSNHPGLSTAAKAELCRDIARGLITLHRCGVVHGDVKCANILVFEAKDRPSGCRAKVGDFGFSLLDLDEEAALLARSPPWNAPEWNERRMRATLAKSDVYSFGLLALQVFANGINPFEALDLWTEGHADPLAEIENLKQRDELLPLFEYQAKDCLSTDEAEAQLVCSILRLTLKRDPEERHLDEVLGNLDSFLGYALTSSVHPILTVIATQARN